MTLQQIHYVLTIAETKSMSKAAEKLFVSQPTLTKSIKELEQNIGISIFTRTGKGVEVTNNGEEFLSYARQIYQQYELLELKYSSKDIKNKFGVSTQHYSFAVKAFVRMAKHFDLSDYELALRETKTLEVISDVGTLKSEVGIIFRSDYNEKIINKILNENRLTFNELVDCRAFVYLWKGHPLANRKIININDLERYPCLSFEQGDNSSIYLAEEILSEIEHSRTIKTCDRATMLNLMMELNGYTLCSGIICNELNGSDYIAIPFENENESDIMHIGYIVKKNSVLSDMGNIFINELKAYFKN